MSNLENLTQKILEDSREKARQITDAARQEARKAIDAKTDEARRESEAIIAAAHIEAERTAQRLVQGKTRAVRDENLAAKREMLDKVFAEALLKLNGMPRDEYLKYLKDYLLKLSLDGEEIILPKQYAIQSIDDINAALEKAGKNGNLALCTDPARAIDGGFVLVKQGIEQNHTFAALLSYYRQELESEVLKILYA